MKIQNTILFACLTLLLAAPSAYAIDADAGTSASAFLKIDAGSPRAQALGNAYVSIAEGPEALFWNPAGAASATTKEIQFSYQDYLQGYASRTLAYLHPMGKTIIGVTLNYMDMDGFDYRDEYGNLQPIVDKPVQNFVGSLSLARGFFDQKLQLGATAKYINEKLDTYRYTNVGFDVGAKARPWQWLGLGGAIVNIGDKDEMPRGWRLGADINTKYSRSQKINIIKNVLDEVGLAKNCTELYPHEFSGGQRQRIAIARALVLNPKLIIADEPVSALDASIQAQIINLLKELKFQKNLTILFISHDLNVIRYLADRVGIMYFGKLIEENLTENIFKYPKEFYTKTLLDSAPNLVSF